MQLPVVQRPHGRYRVGFCRALVLGVALDAREADHGNSLENLSFFLSQITPHLNCDQRHSLAKRRDGGIRSITQRVNVLETCAFREGDTNKIRSRAKEYHS
jgi:hypothetical protein